MIDGRYVVRAIISLAATADGGLTAPMPTPTPALLPKFTAFDDPHSQTTIGARRRHLAALSHEVSP